MSVFVYRGPLAPDSPLFRDRTAELAQLVQLCQGEVQAYAIIYGGRQTGKTSLLLRLAAGLSKSVYTCRVDFQGLPGASTPQVYIYLAGHVARSLSHPAEVNEVSDAPSLIEFLGQVLNRPEIGQFVLLLEELGALPQTTREDLANVLRAIFTSRFDSFYRSLAKLMVVLAGSIELYELAATQVSTMHNICEAIYLPDLGEETAIGLIANELTKLGLPFIEAEALGQAIYTHVAGHPYLTQRLGGVLEADLTSGKPLMLDCVDRAVKQLLNGDPLLRHLRRALVEQELLVGSQELLGGHLRFSRLDEEMAQLELLGLASEANGYWTVRNRLLARALQDWLTTLTDSPQHRLDLTESLTKGTSIRVAVVRQLLLAAFTTEELRRFCYDTPLFRAVYDEFSPGMGEADLVHRILEFSETQVLMPELLQAVKERNPRQYARFEAKLYLDKEGVKPADDDR